MNNLNTQHHVFTVTGIIGHCSTPTKTDFIVKQMKKLSDKINSFTEDSGFNLVVTEFVGGINTAFLTETNTGNTIIVITQASLVKEMREYGFNELSKIY